MSLGEVSQIVEGVILGALEQESSNVGDCLHNVQKTASDFQEAVNDFKTETISGVKNGIYKVGDIVQDVTDDLHSCEAVVTDLKKLEKMAATFSNPFSFVYHVGKDLMVNGKNIYSDIDAAITDWESASYFSFGENVGKALALTLVGAEYQLYEEENSYGISASELASTLAGLLEGTLHKAVPSTDVCIGDAEKLVQEFKEVVTDFEKETFSGVKDGIHKVGDIVDEVSDDLKHCKLALDDAEKLAQMAKTFKNPFSFIYHVGKNVLVNGKDIYSYVDAAVKAYHEPDYNQFGYQLGEALAIAVIGTEEVKQAFPMYIQ